MTLMAIRGEGAVRVGLDGTGDEIGLIAERPIRAHSAWRVTGRRRQAACPGWTQGMGERAEPH